jgi:hypothetical protein
MTAWPEGQPYVSFWRSSIRAFRRGESNVPESPFSVGVDKAIEKPQLLGPVADRAPQILLPKLDFRLQGGEWDQCDAANFYSPSGRFGALRRILRRSPRAAWSVCRLLALRVGDLRLDLFAVAIRTISALGQAFVQRLFDHEDFFNGEEETRSWTQKLLVSQLRGERSKLGRSEQRRRGSGAKG